MKTRKLVYASLLLMIALLLGGLWQRATGIPISLKLNLGGAKITIDFTMIPLALSGIWLGPVWALMVGFAYDQIGFLLNGGGAWNPIFTLADMAACVVPAFVYAIYYRYKIKKPLIHVAFIILSIYFIFGMFMVMQLLKGVVGVHYGILVIVYAVLVIGSALLLVYLSKKRIEGYYSYEKLFIAILLGAFSRSMISAFGLYTMFGLQQGVTLVYFIAPRLITVLILSYISTSVIMLLMPALKKDLRH